MEEQRHTASHSWIKFGKIAGGVLLGWFFWFMLLIVMLRFINPPFTAFTLQDDWDESGKESYNLRAEWVPDKEIPDHLKLAVIASEDQRFYAHWGLDLAAIDKALEEKEQSGRIRGASTITQQVAKNLFLTPAQTYFRKGIEAGITVLIEVFWPKDRILEVYLNIAEFGPGIYGIGKASQFWYGKEIGEITPKESARLATVLPNPALIEPRPASEYVQERSRWILRNMQQLSGVRYLPKSDTVDTTENTALLPDSIFQLEFPDSLIVSSPDSQLVNPKIDSAMMEIGTDSLAF